MAEQVKTTSLPDSGLTAKPTPSAPVKPAPNPGTYVVKVPKDQIYRVPPPENARLYKNYTRGKNRRSRCCCCLCWLIGLIFIFVILLGIAAGVLYLVFRPEALDYSVDRIAIKGINLTSATASAGAELSPQFDVAVGARNPNEKLGIYYLEDSSVEVYYNSDVRLSNGALPAFYQPSNNVTVFKTALKGSGVVLTKEDRRALVEDQTKGKVPLKLKLMAPVKIEVGSVKTWKFTVKVKCDLTVDKLTEHAKIVRESCHYSVNLW